MAFLGWLENRWTWKEQQLSPPASLQCCSFDLLTKQCCPWSIRQGSVPLRDESGQYIYCLSYEVSSLVIAFLRSLLLMWNSSKLELCSLLTSGSERLLCSAVLHTICQLEAALHAVSMWQMMESGTIPSARLSWIMFKVQLLACCFCASWRWHLSFVLNGKCHVPAQGGC